MTPASEAETTRGVWYGALAYALWGGMPVFFLALAPSGPWEILAHRILWSLVLCGALLLATRSGGALRRAFRTPRGAIGIITAGLLIAVNWTTYVVAATSGHITDAALGYFLNPIVSVVLGLVVLGETLRGAQKVAVVIGAAGAGYLALAAGGVPWLALILAFSFGLYGLVKKRIGASLSAVESLAGETIVLAPVAAGLLWWCVETGRSTFFGHGIGHAAMLAAAGVITTVPLLLFAAATRRVTLVTIGLLQFIAPVLQFVAGLATGEVMTPARWVGFAVVWCALIVLVVDSIREGRRTRRARRARGREDDLLP